MSVVVGVGSHTLIDPCVGDVHGGQVKGLSGAYPDTIIRPVAGGRGFLGAVRKVIRDLGGEIIVRGCLRGVLGTVRGWDSILRIC